MRSSVFPPPCIACSRQRSRASLVLFGRSWTSSGCCDGGRGCASRRSASSWSSLRVMVVWWCRPCVYARIVDRGIVIKLSQCLRGGIALSGRGVVLGPRATLFRSRDVTWGERCRTARRRLARIGGTRTRQSNCRLCRKGQGAEKRE